MRTANEKALQLTEKHAVQRVLKQLDSIGNTYNNLKKILDVQLVK